jgi:hypothetical protein
MFDGRFVHDKLDLFFSLQIVFRFFVFFPCLWFSEVVDSQKFLIGFSNYFTLRIKVHNCSLRFLLNFFVVFSSPNSLPMTHFHSIHFILFFIFLFKVLLANAHSLNTTYIFNSSVFINKAKAKTNQTQIYSIRSIN